MRARGFAHYDEHEHYDTRGILGGVDQARLEWTKLGGSIRTKVLKKR